jgi:hypothetical protein
MYLLYLDIDIWGIVCAPQIATHTDDSWFYLVWLAVLLNKIVNVLP